MQQVYCRKCGSKLKEAESSQGFDPKTGKEVKVTLFSCPDGTEAEGHDVLDQAGVDKLLAE